MALRLLGFGMVHAEVSLAKQYALFSEATVVIGPQGAA
jgi:capsular polysaccharide biosynthesis protein